MTEPTSQPEISTESKPSADPRLLVEQVVKMLVDEPAEVIVDEFPEKGITVFELVVAPDDIGKVIGKSGRTVRALRTLLDAVGVKQGKRYELDVIEEDEDGDIEEGTDEESAESAPE